MGRGPASPGLWGRTGAGIRRGAREAQNGLFSLQRPQGTAELLLLLRAVRRMRRGRGKRKAEVTEAPPVSRSRTEEEEAIQQARRRAAPSVREFKYNKKRVRLVSQGPDLKDDARCILYWMCRDQRVQGANQLVEGARMGGKKATVPSFCRFGAGPTLYRGICRETSCETPSPSCQ